MAEAEETAPSPIWKWLRVFGLTIGTVFFCGMIGGFVAAHLEKDAGLTLRFAGILAAMAVAAFLCLWLLISTLRKQARLEPLTRRERLNRNILFGSGVIGFVMAMLVAFSGEQGLDQQALLSNAPLPTGIAVVLVLLIGLVVPALSIYWHRSAVDEQEADAYKTGALVALYVFMIGAPVWWFAWRGGFAPEPDGLVIYCVVTLTVGVIWIWKKYR